MKYLLPTVQFNTELLKKYDQPLPRYTSYPPATELRSDFGTLEYKQAIAALNQRSSPLSLYVHIPFCQSACYFCGCNVIISNNKNIALPYLEYLIGEIQQTAVQLDSNKPVVQMHWGGGTPNYLTIEQVELLWKVINRNFNLATDAEISIEINPRYVDKSYIQTL
jgi:oxygen-independent coproporphyrinogen-3 oxidase